MNSGRSTSWSPTQAATRPGRRPSEEVSEEDWRGPVDANLTATFLMVKSFLPGMKQRGDGSIITVSSAAGRRANAMSPVPYAAARAGIQILTQDLAAQAGPYGIRVNCIAPETILTERNKQQIPRATQEALAGTHPMRRLGTPEDVARAALFLASDDAAWITGTIADSVQLGITWKRGGHGRFDGSHEVLASHR
jgi:3-oxoacyl-[acyl-carrier protein] reductase